MRVAAATSSTVVMLRGSNWENIDMAYRAKQFKVVAEEGEFHVAGTSDGGIDLGILDERTYLLSVREATDLRDALSKSITDVKDNHCHAS